MNALESSPVYVCVVIGRHRLVGNVLVSHEPALLKESECVMITFICMAVRLETLKIRIGVRR